MWRAGKVIATDRIESLRRFRDDVREVATNYECGIGLAGFNDLEEGDIIECFSSQTVSRVASAYAAWTAADSTGMRTDTADRRAVPAGDRGDLPPRRRRPPDRVRDDHRRRDGAGPPPRHGAR